MDDEEEFVEAIVESLGEQPSNHRETNAMNRGREPLTEEAEELELGPNDCAAS